MAGMMWKKSQPTPRVKIPKMTMKKAAAQPSRPMRIQSRMSAMKRRGSTPMLTEGSEGRMVCDMRRYCAFRGLQRKPGQHGKERRQERSGAKISGPGGEQEQRGDVQDQPQRLGQGGGAAQPEHQCGG